MAGALQHSAAAASSHHHHPRLAHVLSPARPRRRGWEHNRVGREVLDISGRKVEVFPQESGITSAQPSLFYFSLPRIIGHLELSFLHHHFIGDNKSYSGFFIAHVLNMWEVLFWHVSVQVKIYSPIPYTPYEFFPFPDIFQVFLPMTSEIQTVTAKT